MNRKLFYLAAPYASQDPEIMAMRVVVINNVAAAIFEKGDWVFSPISHNHPIKQHNRCLDREIWMPFDLHMLSLCDELLVLKLDGWEQSIGVDVEIKYAQILNKPVQYILPDELHAMPNATPVWVAKELKKAKHSYRKIAASM